MASSWFDDAIRDLKVATVFLTRLPVRVTGDLPSTAIGRALRLAPLVGLLVGLAGGLAYGLALDLGLPPLVAGLLAVAVTMLATGALHEDGLADVADGFGGGRDAEGKRAIMRDSRLGTFGAASLFLSILLRAAALAAAGGSGLAALVAAHAVSRALLAPVMAFTPAASTEGLAADAGDPSPRDAGIALALGGLLALLALGLSDALLALLLAAAAAGAILWLARRMIGGYTGDVLGAVQQMAEITILLVAAGTL